MPWDELEPRASPAFKRQLEGISSQTMEDHHKLYAGYAKKADECRALLNQFDYGEIEGNQVYSSLRAVSIDYTFALLGYFGATSDGRKRYVEAFVDKLDWDHVNRQLIQAEAARAGAINSGARELTNA